MSAAVPANRTRRTQQERSASTRGKLLDATVECLVEFGYNGTTTTAITERAGVSRGAQLHHYPTKADLVTATVEHLARQLGETVARKAADLPTGENSERAEAAIDLLWSAFETPLFEAWLELWVAGRTDPELVESLRPVERALGEGVPLHSRAVFGGDHAETAYGDLIQQTLMFLQGVALNRAMATDRESWRRREAKLLAGWKGTVRAILTS